jgi:hypothetical protein
MTALSGGRSTADRHLKRKLCFGRHCQTKPEAKSEGNNTYRPCYAVVHYIRSRIIDRFSITCFDKLSGNSPIFLINLLLSIART